VVRLKEDYFFILAIIDFPCPGENLCGCALPCSWAGQRGL